MDVMGEHDGGAWVLKGVTRAAGEEGRHTA